MSNQEILDNAPEWADTYRKLLDYPDCTTYANNAKDEQVLDRSLADISKIAELELSRKELIEEFAEAECMGDLAKIARNHGYEEQE
tara:strand:- start:735 stop:992 length:258 start_codon:yes stop_codon:yes gene_type:complete